MALNNGTLKLAGQYGISSYDRIVRERIESFGYADCPGHPVWIEVYTLMLDGMERDVELIKERYWDAADEFEVWKPHAWSNIFPDLRPRQEDRR